ncbi:MAG: ribonuclease H-like domain-containing protein [Patescibacteria group bacterium]
MGHVLVYDLETKKTFDEVGGQGNPHLLEVSLAGIYNYTDDQYHALKENELDRFKDMLKECELLVGFNSRHFDNKVLQPYYKDFDVDSVPHLDMLEVVSNHLGFRVKLDNLAQTTLLEGKSGSGLDAIRYYRLGQWDQLTQYCLDDVRVTRDVYEYGKTHGYIWYIESGTPTKIPITWGEGETVDDMVDKALAEHRQLEIEYIVPGATSKEKTIRYKTKLDVESIDGDAIVAFSHKDQKKKTFQRPRIFTAHLNGKSSAYQQSLI